MHMRTWQVAYRGIVPDGHLDTLDVAARARRYTFDHQGPGHPETWIAVDGEQVVGMVTLGPNRDEDLAALGEVVALYVAPERWGSGAGRALLGYAERRLSSAGFEAATLWVLRDNARARRFYEARGWAPDGGTKTVDIGGRPLVEVRYRKALAGGPAGARA